MTIISILQETREEEMRNCEQNYLYLYMYIFNKEVLFNNTFQGIHLFFSPRKKLFSRFF